MSQYKNVRPGMGQYRIDIGPATQTQYRLPQGGFLERVELVMYKPVLFEYMADARLTAYLECYGRKIDFDRLFGFYTDVEIGPATKLWF